MSTEVLREVVKTNVHNAALCIAGALRHAWSDFAHFGEDGYVLFEEKAAKEAEKASQLPDRFYPDNHDTSTTGRLDWTVIPKDNGTAIVFLKILRPGRIVGVLDSVTVIEAQFAVDKDCKMRWNTDHYIMGCALAEDRHYGALAEVLHAFDLDVDFIDDNYDYPFFIEY